MDDFTRRLKADFGTQLQLHMTASGKTRKDLCRELGIKYTTLAEWLQGGAFPRIETLAVLACYFNISLSDLIRIKEIIKNG